MNCPGDVVDLTSYRASSAYEGDYFFLSTDSLFLRFDALARNLSLEGAAFSGLSLLFNDLYRVYRSYVDTNVVSGFEFQNYVLIICAVISGQKQPKCFSSVF